ncbi:MAG: hypothetical protein M3O86_02220 [Actinomycetota bacterium]|nr:hypothetical protein [Actinomycetota bacterium]
MDPQTLRIIIIAAAVVVVVLLVLAVLRARRKRRERDELRQRYGPEYERTVQQRGSQRAAVRDLRAREQEREQLSLRNLNDADRELVRRHMASLQYRFVEDPADVLLGTDRVATEVLRAKGYPVAENRERALRLFSVDYPKEAEAIRSVMERNHGGDVTRMRETFVGVRAALQEVTGVSYVLGDAVESPSALPGASGGPTGELGHG